MSSVTLKPDRRGFVFKLLRDLLNTGWHLLQAPADGTMPNNGVRLMLKGEDYDLRVRVFLYKVTSSSRGRPHERRIEITSTYIGGLRRASGFRDVVLGVDVDSGKYVGVDPRRLRMGGTTHNASSFFDREGLDARHDELRVNPRAVASSDFSGGIETHAFFEAPRLAEYLFNRDEIHAGHYGYAGPFSGVRRRSGAQLPASVPAGEARGDVFVLASRAQQRRKPAISLKFIQSFERGDLSVVKRKVSPQQLKQMLALWDEIGALGEQAVLTSERNRLRRLGLVAQAARVERVSLTSVGEGYDISSFEDDGVTKRYIEVKSTTGSGLIVDMSRGEWKTARRYRNQYYLARVTRAKSEPTITFIRNPVDLERSGLVTRVAIGWRVDLRSAPSES